MRGWYFAKISLRVKIVQGFAHFFFVHGDVAVVHPEFGEGFSVGRFTLGDFTFMMREFQIEAAAVDVEGFAKKL